MTSRDTRSTGSRGSGYEENDSRSGYRNSGDRYDDDMRYGRSEREYRSENRGRSAYHEDMGGREGRSIYGNDRDYGRNQDRYGSSNQRNTGRYADEWRSGNQGRSGYDSGWNPGDRSGRTNYGDSRGYGRNQENYPQNEWRGQRQQGWSQYDHQMEKNDGYRKSQSGMWGRRRIRPTGKNDEGLRQLLTDQLKDIYWAEKALTKAIPKLIKKASSAELVDALNEHLDQTREQVQKLEEVFGLMGSKASGKKCEGMEGLIKEADQIIAEMEEGAVRDAGIICAAQKVEHYEIATYGCLSTYAEILDEMEIVDILEEILSEEKRADKILTQVAQAINWEAAEEEDEDDDTDEEDEEEEEELSVKTSEITA